MCEAARVVFASTVCYGDSFTPLYVDDVRTSQETRASTVCYGDIVPRWYLYIHISYIM
jgi:hypothetical protein